MALLVTNVFSHRHQGVKPVLESHDLEGHVTGGQDKDGHPARRQTQWPMKNQNNRQHAPGNGVKYVGWVELLSCQSALASCVPTHESELTGAGRWAGWPAATPAGKACLWAWLLCLVCLSLRLKTKKVLCFHSTSRDINRAAKPIHYLNNNLNIKGTCHRFFHSELCSFLILDDLIHTSLNKNESFHSIVLVCIILQAFSNI